MFVVKNVCGSGVKLYLCHKYLQFSVKKFFVKFFNMKYDVYCTNPINVCVFAYVYLGPKYSQILLFCNVVDLLLNVLN